MTDAKKEAALKAAKAVFDSPFIGYDLFKYADEEVLQKLTAIIEAEMPDQPMGMSAEVKKEISRRIEAVKEFLSSLPTYERACWIIWNQTDKYIVGLTHDTLKSAEDLITKHNWKDCIIKPLFTLKEEGK